MTAFAALAEAPVVLVITGVTGVAGRGRAHRRAYRLAVTGVAVEPLMPAIEDEIGLLVFEPP